jgi:spermidine synthase
VEFWFSEKQTKNFGISCRIEKILHKETTEYQELAVIDTLQFGRMLVLDEAVQTTIKDEFVYHEMITHIPLFTHGNPERALIVGGGDGGAIREMLKHPSIKEAHLVEIDGRVVDLSREFLPEISVALDDPRVKVFIKDGIEHVRNSKGYYDIIIVDSTDPIGPAVGLFAKEFYNSIYEALREDGIFVAQTESPYFNQDLIKRVFGDIKDIFPIAMLYTANIPTYPSGYWSFSMGSKKNNPRDIILDKVNFDTRYFNAEIFKSAFALPNFVKEIIEEV